MAITVAVSMTVVSGLSNSSGLWGSISLSYGSSFSNRGSLNISRPLAVVVAISSISVSMAITMPITMAIVSGLSRSLAVVMSIATISVSMAITMTISMAIVSGLSGSSPEDGKGNG